MGKRARPGDGAEGDGAAKRDAPKAAEAVSEAAAPSSVAVGSVAPGAGRSDDDLEFPGDVPPPIDPREADAEAARVADALARNRVATARAVIVGFIVATAVFFGVAYAFPESERGFSLLAIALGAGAFVGVGVWALSRSKAPVFDPGPLPADAPVDQETRRIEARAREHDRRNRIALALGAAAFVLAGPVVLYLWSQHLEALNEARLMSDDFYSVYTPREEVGNGRGLLVLFGAAIFGAFVTWVLRPKVDVLSELGGATVEREGAPASLSKVELAELRAIAAEVRAKQRREAFAHGGSVVVFVLVVGAVYLLGFGVLLGAIVGAVASAGFHRLASGSGGAPKLDALEIPDRGRDWFADTVATTRSITFEVPGDLEALLGRMVGVAVNRWTLVDGTGAALAEVNEVALPFLERLRPARPRRIEVRDLDRTPLVLRRAGGLFEGDWKLDADGAPAGSIVASFFGHLVLRDAAGKERLAIRRSFFGGRSRPIVRDGTEIGRVEWPRRGVFSTRLDRPGLVVDLPEGTPIEERRLLLAAGLVLDLDRA